MFGQASNLFGSQPVTTSLYQQPSTTQTTSMFNTQPSVSTPSSNLFGQGPPQPSVTAPLMFGQSQPAAPIQPIFGQIQNTSSVPSFGSSVKVGPTNTTSLFGLNTQSQSNTAPATLGFGQTYSTLYLTIFIQQD